MEDKISEGTCSPPVAVAGHRVDFGDLTIVSWNVNGLRSLSMKDVLSTGFGGMISNCSILAVQETKLTRSQLEESQAFVDNYTSYFSFSKNRAGYSGVANYCHSSVTPKRAEDGIAGTNLDSEYKTGSGVGNYLDIGENELGDAKYGDNDGRCIITQHVVYEPNGTERLLNVINVYCPRLRDDPCDPVNNRQFKLRFHNFVSERARRMVQNGEFVLVVGDLNVSHHILDQSDVDDPKKFTHHEFRQWLDDLLSDNDDGMSFIDTFRMRHHDRAQAFTCWNTKLNARQNNYGARIDFIIADSDLAMYLKDADVHQSVMGSDHCPISATFHSLKLQSNPQIPNFASKFYPEFSGKQLKLVDLFKRQEVANPATSPNVQNEPRKRPAKPPKQTSLTSFLIKKPKLDSNSDTTESGIALEDKCSEDLTPSPGEGVGFYQQVNTHASAAWRQLMKTPETPVCSGHSERCVLRTSKKPGTNLGRQFWACSRGLGKSGDPNSNCNFFKWANSKS